MALRWRRRWCWWSDGNRCSTANRFFIKYLKKFGRIKNFFWTFYLCNSCSIIFSKPQFILHDWSPVTKGVNNEWLKIGFIEGIGKSFSPQDYSYIDAGLTPGIYNYRLKQIDFNGNYEYFNLIMKLLSDYQLGQLATKLLTRLLT